MTHTPFYYTTINQVAGIKACISEGKILEE
jgi:hypothetical protein